MSKGKVILLFPPLGYFSQYNTPTGTLYVATCLQEKGYNVKFIDCSIETDYRRMTLNELDGALCVGAYSMTGHIKHFVPLLEEIKSTRPDVKVVLGGPHATIFPSQTAEDELVDFVVRGEGEKTMLELVEAFESNATDFSNIKGISYVRNGKVINTPDREFLDLGSLPFVNWNLMNPIALNSMSSTIARVQASRGCPYTCTFCINVVSKNSKMRYRPPASVVDEIERMVKDLGVRRIGFRDEIFLTNRQQVREIAEEIIRRDIKITWLANPYPTFLRERWVDDEFLGLLVRSGCTKLSCGAESGNQRVLRLLKKDITPDDVLHFVKRCKSFNIQSVISFMTGLPGETEQEQLDTLRLIWKILEIDPTAYMAGPQLWRPYPGGELFEKAMEFGFKLPKTFKEWIPAMDTLGGPKPPWVKKIYFSQFVWFHVRHARLANLGQLKEEFNWRPHSVSPGIVLKSLANIIFAKLALFRLKRCFYRFLVEFKLLQMYWWRVRGGPPEYS